MSTPSSALHWSGRQRLRNSFDQTQSCYCLHGSVAIGRCRVLLLKHDVDAAWAMCRPLTETDDVDKIVAIGMLFSSAEQYQQALEAWQKAVALDADSSEIQYNLALSCFHL